VENIDKKLRKLGYIRAQAPFYTQYIKDGHQIDLRYSAEGVVVTVSIADLYSSFYVEYVDLEEGITCCLKSIKEKHESTISGII